MKRLEDGKDACKKISEDIKKDTNKDQPQSPFSLKEIAPAFTSKIPGEHRPKITDIEKKYGKPDKIEGDVHFYGKIGLRVEKNQDNNTVVEFVVDCGRIKY